MKVKNAITALTVGSFGVVLLTGMMIFLEFSIGGIRGTHEWMSIVFSLIICLHITTYRKSFTKYFTTKYILLICAIILPAVIMLYLGSSDIYASGATFDLLVNVDIATLAKVMDMSPDQVVKIIQESGAQMSNNQDSLLTIANANNMEIYDLIDPLLEVKQTK